MISLMARGFIFTLMILNIKADGKTI